MERFHQGTCAQADRVAFTLSRELEHALCQMGLACAGLMLGQESVPGGVKNRPQESDRFGIVRTTFRDFHHSTPLGHTAALPKFFLPLHGRRLSVTGHSYLIFLLF
jgi:hypothetical protein